MGLVSSGGPAVKFASVGSTFSGVITSVKELDDIDPGTKQAKRWENGDVKKVYALGCEPDTPRADGEPEVTLWVSGHLYTQVKAQARFHSLKSDQELVGFHIQATHTSVGKARSSALNAPKLFEVILTPGEPTTGLVDGPEEPF